MKRTVTLLERHDFDRTAMYADLQKQGLPLPPGADKAIEAAKLAKAAVFEFRTPLQKLIWDEQIRGQITDGHWENGVSYADLFWYDVPSALGSKTVLKGARPAKARTRFGIASAFGKGGNGPLGSLIGETMMNASNKELAGEKLHSNEEVYAELKEIDAAIAASKAAPASKKEAEGKGKMSPMSGGAGRGELDDMLRAAMKVPGGAAKEPEFSALLVGDVPGRIGQQHYFAAWEAPDGTWYGGSVFVKGGKAKAVPVATGDEAKVMKALERKIASKRGNYSVAEAMARAARLVEDALSGRRSRPWSSTLALLEAEATMVLDKKDLPPSIRKAVEAEFGGKKPTMYLVPSERFKTRYDPNDVMHRVVLVDVSGGRSAGLPFGGRFGEFHDIDEPIPPGGAVLEIAFYGSGSGSVRIHVHPDTVNKMALPEPSSGLSDEEVIVLSVHAGTKPAFRAEYLQGLAGVDEARARLVQLGHLNKAGAVTTKGRNYLLGMRAEDKDRVQKAAEKATGRYFNRI